MYSVYIHENKSNGKKYVGITSCDVKRRWRNGLGYSEHLPIGRAIQKYGWDGFSHLVLCDELSEEDAKLIEKELIKELDTQNPERGYNICAGGEGTTGWHPSEETRQKISESAKRRTGINNANYGNMEVFRQNSGMQIALERLRGHRRFGYVKLLKTERSETAAMADLLD